MALLPRKREERGLADTQAVRSLASLRAEMNRVFDSFWHGDFGLESMREWGSRFNLDLDVVEGENSVTIKADTPGMDPKDIDISVVGNTLTIKGEKKEESEDKGKDYYRSERRYGSFVRSIQLPSSVDAEKVKAEYKKGVLKITMPKLESEKPKRIEVKSE